MSQQFPTFRFEPPPPFVKAILLGAAAVYIAQQILMGWVNIPLADWIAWSPNTTFSRPWALLTHFLLLFNSPIGFLFEMVAVYFFLPVIIESYGRKGFNRLLLWIAIVTSIFGVLGVVTGAIPSTSAPAFGLHPILIAMIAIFGLKNPFATICLDRSNPSELGGLGLRYLSRTQLLCWTFPRIFTGHWRLDNRLSFCHWQWTDQTQKIVA